MAKQSQGGGASWSAYMRQPSFRKGYQDFLDGKPLDYDFEPARSYEAGRLMAAESGLPLPPAHKRRSKDLDAVIKSCPAMQKQFGTERALAAIEARAQAALRLRFMHAERQKEHAAATRSRLLSANISA